MSEHLESPLPKKGSIYPTQTQGEMIQAALADARNTLHLLENTKPPGHLSIKNQKQIIAQYERQLRDLGVESWPS